MVYIYLFNLETSLKLGQVFGNGVVLETRTHKEASSNIYK